MKDVKNKSEETLEAPEQPEQPNGQKSYNLHTCRSIAIMEDKDDGGQKCIGYDVTVVSEPVKKNIRIEEEKIKGPRGLDRAIHSRNCIHIEAGQPVPRMIERRNSTKKEMRETGREFQDNIIF